MSNSKRRLLGWMAAGLAAGQLAMPTTAFAQTNYNVASLADFTGPYADVMKNLVGGRWAVVAWWNEEVGKGLGVKINMKDFDHRYDAAQVASLWPGIKSELKPIAVLGVGGPDVAALQQRLPDDKIPMLMSTAGYGFAWRQDPWIFNPRPTYAHEAAAFYNWYRTKKGITGPLKVAIISSEASPAYVDIHKGANLYASENKDKVEIVETVFTEVQPSDLSTQVSRVVRKGAQIIHIQTNTAAVVATKRALQSIGRKDIPIMLSSHNGLPASGAAAGGWPRWRATSRSMAWPFRAPMSPRRASSSTC
jgi:branched-chain amino acid transport system substrate-binding protein